MRDGDRFFHGRRIIKNSSFHVADIRRIWKRSGRKRGWQAVGVGCCCEGVDPVAVAELDAPALPEPDANTPYGLDVLSIYEFMS